MDTFYKLNLQNNNSHTTLQIFCVKNDLFLVACFRKVSDPMD